MLTEAEVARFRRLCDEADLRALIADYAETIDWLDWTRMETLFWPDATLDFGMFAGDFTAYMAFVKALEESYRRRLHMFAEPTFRITGDDARVDAGSVIVCRTDNDAHGVDDIFWGRYLFTAQRRDGAWRLAGLTYMMNLAGGGPRTADDRGTVMRMGDDLTPTHPLAPRGS